MVTAPMQDVDAFFNNLGSSFGEALSALSVTAPIALNAIVSWLHDWQVLVAGILAIIAAHIWGRAVLRASEFKGRRRAESEALRTARAAPRTTTDLRTTPQILEDAPRIQLAGLRSKIRLVLGKIPCTDDVLTSSQLLLCRDVGKAFLAGELLSEKGKRELAAIREKASALVNLLELDTCRTAWQALIALNAAARDYETSLNSARRNP